MEYELMYIPMIINKITPSVDPNHWLKIVDTISLETITIQYTNLSYWANDQNKIIKIWVPV